MPATIVRPTAQERAALARYVEGKRITAAHVDIGGTLWLGFETGVVLAVMSDAEGNGPGAAHLHMKGGELLGIVGGE